MCKRSCLLLSTALVMLCVSSLCFSFCSARKLTPSILCVEDGAFLFLFAYCPPGA